MLSMVFSLILRSFVAMVDLTTSGVVCLRQAGSMSRSSRARFADGA